jgi:NAD(P)-dependent dehydrogenase (short-subunit alcohol dehydrogenase family)
MPQTILVTGGGRGIGRAIALAFAEPGFVVAIAARTRSELDETADAIGARGARPVTIAVDVTDEGAVAAGFDELRAVSPRLNVLVNNAGVGGGQLIHKTDTRALALELVKRGITVNAICPGWVDTAMAAQGMQAGANAMGLTFDEFRAQALGDVPIQRIIQPEEIASLVKFLASPQASAITGQTYNICGGQIMN